MFLLSILCVLCNQSLLCAETCAGFSVVPETERAGWCASHDAREATTTQCVDAGPMFDSSESDSLV